MVPYRQSVEQPLLPYEKRLIAALGCSEQEYRQFAQEVERRYKERLRIMRIFQIFVVIQQPRWAQF